MATARVRKTPPRKPSRSTPTTAPSRARVAAAAADKEVSGLGPALEFMQLLWGVQHGLESHSKRLEMSTGVTAPQRMVLRVLGKRPGTSGGEIAQVLRVHPSTLSGVLRRLEARGLVQRTEDEADRRRTLFRLTSAGQEIDRDRSSSVEANVRRALRKLSSEQIEAAQQVLSTLATELQHQGR